MIGVDSMDPNTPPDKYGTLDFEKEAPLLEKIEGLYEAYMDLYLEYCQWLH